MQADKLVEALQKIVAVTSATPSMTERQLGTAMGRIQEICEAALAAHRSQEQAGQAARVDLVQIAKRAGISMDCWDVGAASLAFSEGCEGITRAHLERFAALYGFACWNAALEANPPNMLGFVGRALDDALAGTTPQTPALNWRRRRL